MAAWLAALLLVPCLAMASGAPVSLRTEMEAGAEMKWNIDGKGGICPEVLHAITRRDPGLAFTWSNSPVPQKRLVAEAEQGRIDIACGLGRTPEREQSLAMLPVPLYDDALVAAVRKGDSLELGTLSDLGKLPAGDAILLTYGARLVGRLAEMGIHQVDDGARRPADNLEKLVRGRGRVFLYHEPGMAWEIRQAGLNDKIDILPAVLSIDQHYLWVSRRVPPDVVKRIGEALIRMKSDGSLRAIARRWSPGLDLDGSSLHAGPTQEHEAGR